MWHANNTLQPRRMRFHADIHDLGAYFGSEFLKAESLIVILCCRGEQHIDIGQRSITLAANDLLLCPFGSLLSHFRGSDDVLLMVVELAPDMISHSFFTDGDFWKYVDFIYSQKPVTLAPADVELFRHYQAIYRYHSQQRDEHFHADILQFLNSELFYELICLIARSITPQYEPGRAKSTQPMVIFKNFITLLGQNKGRRHKVKDFADALCVSPKYLSSITKEVCKKSPKQMIDDEITTVIKQQLLYSSKSVKEIANDLNFPNLSFFGKFTKEHLGASPLNIRQGGKK